MGKYNVMIGPIKTARGGISTVVDQYEAAGFFEALNCRYWVSWREGTGLRKLLLIGAVAARLVGGLLLRRIGLVHIQSACKTSFMRKSLFMAIANLFGVPVLFHLHCGEFVAEHEQRSALSRWWAEFIINRCTVVILLTEGWRAPMCSIVRDARRIHVVGNPIALQLPAGWARQPRVPGRLNLLFLGLFIADKGIFDLVAAVAALRRQGLDIRVRCGGTGDIARLEAALAEHGVSDAFELLGWIDYSQKMNEFATADVFVLPSYYEGQPMSILEAMTTELLVVSTNVGGIPDTLANEHEGFLVPPGDLPALQAVLERIYRAPDCGIAQVRNAKERVLREHSPPAVLQQLQAIYAAAEATDR